MPSLCPPAAAAHALPLLCQALNGAGMSVADTLSGVLLGCFFLGVVMLVCIVLLDLYSM